MTISPTHVSGKKEYAWNKFRTGNPSPYIAIGWLRDVNLKGKSIDEVISIIKAKEYENEDSAIDAFTKFWRLQIGDYVAVNNTNHGLFGVGIVTSGYEYEKGKHDAGAKDPEEFYSHYREVEWKYTDYVRRRDILGRGEVGWRPYGTVGSLEDEVPPYVRRLLGETAPGVPGKINYIIPDYLGQVVRRIQRLKEEPTHSERDHESLVEEFFQAIGYQKDREIKYRQGRMDVSIWDGKNPLLVVEVKPDWGLTQYKDPKVIQQAYNYALNHGVRYVAITNGDYYALFDRLKGLSYSSNCIGEFSITALEEEDLTAINRMKRNSLTKPGLEELFRHLSESFRA